MSASEKRDLAQHSQSGVCDGAALDPGFIGSALVPEEWVAEVEAEVAAEDFQEAVDAVLEEEEDEAWDPIDNWFFQLVEEEEELGEEEELREEEDEVEEEFEEETEEEELEEEEGEEEKEEEGEEEDYEEEEQDEDKEEDEEEAEDEDKEEKEKDSKEDAEIACGACEFP